jgi:hypothetical protein
MHNIVTQSVCVCVGQDKTVAQPSTTRVLQPDFATNWPYPAIATKHTPSHRLEPKAEPEAADSLSLTCCEIIVNKEMFVNCGFPQLRHSWIVSVKASQTKGLPREPHVRLLFYYGAICASKKMLRCPKLTNSPNPPCQPRPPCRRVYEQRSNMIARVTKGGNATCPKPRT